MASEQLFRGHTVFDYAIRNAKERRPGALGVAEVMVLEYNGRKKTASQHRLLIRKLYEKPKKSQDRDTLAYGVSSDEGSLDDSDYDNEDQTLSEAI